MPRTLGPEVKEEAIRLRLEDQLGLEARGRLRRRLGDRTCPWCDHEFPNTGLHGELLGCDGSYLVRGVCSVCGWSRTPRENSPDGQLPGSS